MFKLCVILSFLVISNIANAKDFYSGKTITIYSNSGVGSLPDLTARLFAKHLSDLISGKPEVIVVNKSGGGGLLAPNYLSEVAPNDGTNIGYFSNILVAKYFGDDKLSFDPTKAVVLYRYIRNPLVIMSNRIPNNMKHIIDNKTLINFGIEGSAGEIVNIAQRMAFDIMGINVKVISGYKTKNEILLNIERGEIDSASVHSFAFSNMSKPNNLVSLWQHGVASDSISLYYLYQNIYGKSPDGIAWESYKFIDNIQDNQIIMLGNSPKAAIDAMNIAIDKISRSIEFKEELYELGGKNQIIMFGKDAQNSIKEITEPTAEILSYVKSYRKTEK